MTGDARERAAVKRAQTLRTPDAVRRLRLGVYVVPSASDARVLYTVTGVGPRLFQYRCSCPAGDHGHVCHHVAGVALRRVREQALRDRRRQLDRTAALEAAA